MVGVLAAILDHAVPLDDAMEKEGHDLIIILEPQWQFWAAVFQNSFVRDRRTSNLYKASFLFKEDESSHI